MRHFCRVMAIVVLPSVAFAAEVDFDTQIVPLLSKAGCNAASCHGSAAGQAGFRLSLFGGDPAFDYRTIVHELEGRRVNHVAPADSLVLAKPTGQLDHGGGQVLPLDGEAASTIAAWIAAGTPRLELRQLVRLEVAPQAYVAKAVPATLQVSVTAVFNDGVRRDVTRDAVYISQNDAALHVDEGGEVTVSLPGRHVATVRFGSHVESLSVTAPIGNERKRPPAEAEQNWIDEEVHATLHALSLAPAPPADDATYLRRLSLDLTGRLPTPPEVERFVANEHPDKRSDLIDQLLASDEFVDFWTHRLATQLRLRKPGTDGVAAEAFYRWLRDQVANDVGWDDIAIALIMSEGDTHQPGAATVHRYFATARDEAEYMSEVLMGVRLRCANCHNHPLDRWTQDDYHGLAAIFAGLERGQVVRYTGRGEVIHPRTGKAADSRIPGARFLAGDADVRRQFADWLTREDNSYFAPAMVGRVWEALMGCGLVTPVDDLRATNPASHPELLERLSRYFVEHDYQLRPLIRLVCQSAAYGRSASPTAGSPPDERFYSYAITKPLSAEVLADAISDVTGVADDYDGVTRAVNVVDRARSSPTLEFLGQCLPGEACSADNRGSRGIASKLHLMNGELLNEKIGSTAGRLQRRLTAGAATAELVEEFYLRALSRQPSHQELADWVDRIDTAADASERAARCEDFLWALLNCHEFTTNH